jgi:hypothetical protein
MTGGLSERAGNRKRDRAATFVEQRRGSQWRMKAAGGDDDTQPAAAKRARSASGEPPKASSFSAKEDSNCKVVEEGANSDAESE